MDSCNGQKAGLFKFIEINEKVFEKFPVLESERLLLRRFEESDAERLYELRSNPKVMQYMDSYPEPNVNAIKFKIQEMNLSYDMRLGINWAIILKDTQKMIGYFGIWKLDKDNCRGEVGYSLDPEFWGNGYMSEAFHLVIPFGFHEMHLHSFEGNVNPYNENSIRILEKHGFRKEAYFRENYFFDGNFLDSMIFSLLEKDWNNL